MAVKGNGLRTKQWEFTIVYQHARETKYLQWQLCQCVI